MPMGHRKISTHAIARRRAYSGVNGASQLTARSPARKVCSTPVTSLYRKDSQYHTRKMLVQIDGVTVRSATGMQSVRRRGLRGNAFGSPTTRSSTRGRAKLADRP